MSFGGGFRAFMVFRYHMFAVAGEFCVCLEAVRVLEILEIVRSLKILKIVGILGI